MMVTLSFTITSIVDFYRLPEKVDATNEALRELTCLKAYYTSLDQVAQRSESTLEHVVEVTEAAQLSLVMAITTRANEGGTGSGGGSGGAERRTQNQKPENG